MRRKRKNHRGWKCYHGCRECKHATYHRLNDNIIFLVNCSSDEGWDYVNQRYKTDGFPIKNCKFWEANREEYTYDNMEIN